MYKHKLLIAVSSLFALLLVSTGVQAQYDDMYYDPDNFRSTEVARDFSDDSYDRAERDDDRRYGNFDDDYYDYYYTSRIRRFNRPYTGFGYYDPVYVDVAYYDPFFRPAGTTVLIYNSFGNVYNPRFSRWGGAYRVWNRGYAGAFGWDDPFFYGRAYNPRFGRGTFGSPFGYGNPYAYGGYGNFGGVYGAGAGYYCPPAWGGGNTYTVPNSINDRPVSTAPRAATTSIADRVERARRNAAVTPRSADGRSIQSGAIRGGENTRAVGRTRTSDDTRIDRSRTTVRPRSTESQRAIPQRATRPDNRTYTPSRSTTPTRSATPSRSGNSRNYTPSRSATPSRNYTPSRSAAPTRSAAPARSVTPSRGSSSGAGRSAAPSRRGGGGDDEA
ncbi:hypothetical protein GGR26_003314 [Lewinella marina]|uniref:Uncharacterized protein n=1 Tax=Neolewinella marina TaxID=438751 RepID=A0A2G0CE11_9BACT|nr:hypothetical protein [Neolewinella marina]NJB87534.1 hypothetical protein [Neolewinella marina]PHK98160.1 hypothetical protein CGL56_10665 [Neolewinella marina]